jgi:hypothetical protein
MIKGNQALRPLSMPRFNPVWKDVEGDWCKNESLASVPFSPLESRIAKEKPGLSQGLEKLRSLLGEDNFRKFISPLHNLTQNGNMLLVIAGDFLQRSLLERECIPSLKEAFGVSKVRIVV